MEPEPVGVAEPDEHDIGHLEIPTLTEEGYPPFARTF